jgi:hypothetical protein
MNFILCLPSLRKGRDSIYFFYRYILYDAMNIINLLFREVVRLHGVLRSIVSN